jgi:hypothetical protein
MNVKAVFREPQMERAYGVLAMAGIGARKLGMADPKLAGITFSWNHQISVGSNLAGETQVDLWRHGRLVATIFPIHVKLT